MKKLVLGILLAIIPTNSFAATIPPHFVLTGSGFGHGVGMSQIGAEGQAMEGENAQYILNYWFPRTTITSVPDTQLIAVNIAHQVSSANITVASGFLQSTMDVSSNADGSINNAGLGSSKSTYKFSLLGNKISASIVNKGQPTQVLPAQPLWNFYWTGTTAFPATQGGDPFTVIKVATSNGSIQLKYGALQLKVVAGKIEITDTMTIDQYILGVSEISSAWLPAALQAQAIGSRTYALAHLTLRKECNCDVYSTIYDQAYIGYAKESEAGVGQNWKAAVTATETDATDAQAIYYQGKPISVYF